MDRPPEVTLSFTRDEALVLLAWLVREDARGGLPSEHLAEHVVIEALEDRLERVLVEHARPDQADVLDAARERVVFGGE